MMHFHATSILTPAGTTKERVSLNTNGKGLLGVAYYDAAKQQLAYVESTSGLTAWNTTTVDPALRNNGQYGSLAYDSKGARSI